MKETKKFFHIPEEQKPLGFGREKRVYNHPDNPDRVIGIYRGLERHSKNFMKATFYLMKILHLLFPETIPDISFSSFRYHAITREKVNLGKSHKALEAAHEHRIQHGEEPPGRILIEADAAEEILENSHDKTEFLEDIQKVVGIIDVAPVNFGFDSRGNLKFVDTILPWYQTAGTIEQNFNTQELRVEIEGLKPEARERGLAYLEKLEKLFTEEKNSIINGK